MSDNSNTYMILICGAAIVVALHLLSKNKQSMVYLGAGKNFTKNSLTEQIKIKTNAQGDKISMGDKNIDVGESNQVILHRYIFEKLQEITNEDYGIKNLTCAYEIHNYSRLTITKKLKQFVHSQVMLPILSKLNASTNMHFKVTTIDRIVKKIAKNGSACLYLIELFIYDQTNFFEKKIIIDMHHDIMSDIYHINSINYSSNDYLCNEIYKPRDTLNDRADNINSNLVVNKTSKPCSKTCDTMNIPGSNNSNIEYTVLNKMNNYNSYTENGQTYNKTSLPPKMGELNSKGMKAFPCGKTMESWDEYGVLIPDSNTKNTCGKDGSCLGNYDSSIQGIPLDTYFHPSSYETRH
jgi:hypothetical protein